MHKVAELVLLTFDTVHKLSVHVQVSEAGVEEEVVAGDLAVQELTVSLWDDIDLLATPSVVSSVARQLSISCPPVL